MYGSRRLVWTAVPRGLDLQSGLRATPGIRWCLIGTSGLLLTSALYCLLVLAPQKTSASSVEQLRRQWRNYATGKIRNTAHGNIAESLLHGTQITASNPNEWAASTANRRGRWFMAATSTLLAALVALAALVVQVLRQL